MDELNLLERIELGENSTTQLIIIGVTDAGEITGISADDIRRINNMVSK